MSLSIITFIGEPSYSSFRLNKINQSLNDLVLQNARAFYVLEISRNLESVEVEQIKQLLHAEPYANSIESNECLVMPRRGTISPWSTKATDIFHHAGLNVVERVESGRILSLEAGGDGELGLLFDRMTEAVYQRREELNALFDHEQPAPVQHINLINSGAAKLAVLNNDLGLALSDDEMKYLYEEYVALGKEPSDMELMMFAQANSEHCRHKIFNAQWHIDGEAQPLSLFKMIKNTEASTSAPATSAYKDNAAVFYGGPGQRMVTDTSNHYQAVDQDIDVLIKVETHNHPTGIEPFAGAATGSGGEIRDEAATGQGAKPKAGLCGFSVSHLHIPGQPQPWEQQSPGTPDRMATSFEIMQKGPIGAAAFNNEFGRPNICGYFRNFEHHSSDLVWRGYHKPIMLAGGMGAVNRIHATKQDTLPGDYVVVLGGPAMLIGLGGGAASSISSADGQEDLDFASVQRGNPEMQRRCQEVIDRCWHLKTESPIRSIHDVGAGGLSNAIPEILDDAGLGGEIELRKLQIDHVSMSPMEIWCNESQERYVISIKPEKLAEFEVLCRRERCPYAVMGQATQAQILRVNDQLFENSPVDIPMGLLFGKTPQTKIEIKREELNPRPWVSKLTSLREQVEQVLAFPTVASKKYLITIGDRTVSGMIHRDQMVGPWQVPVADCGITLRDHNGYAGEAMAVGERTPLALLNPAASARMAVTEAITNLLGVGLESLSQIKLSANWMAASSQPGEYEALFDAVKAIGMELCPDLDVGIPVGKDSMSMHTSWRDGEEQKAVTAPMSLIISAFAPVADVRNHRTPQLSGQSGNPLYLIDLGAGANRMGGAVLCQVQNEMGEVSPDLDNPELLKGLFKLMHEATQSDWLLACHDRSDGGLVATVAEMAFAGRCGVEMILSDSGEAALFAEEPGLVVEIQTGQEAAFEHLLARHGLTEVTQKVARVTDDEQIHIGYGQQTETWSRGDLEVIWSQPSHQMARHRDNPKSADAELAAVQSADPGITPIVGFEYAPDLVAPYLNLAKPRVAILREQGVNGQVEMAAAFMRAGFEAVDVHMQDLIDGHVELNQFNGLAACGGFSYGDVLGAGLGWAKTILFNRQLRAQFSEFFADQNHFALGVCNGCQMLSGLKQLIPGTDHWPQFVRNESEQFEARFSQLQINDTSNVFFAGMAGARIPVAIAHGEGRAAFASANHNQAQVAAQYVDNHGKPATAYPFNPNGSTAAVAAVSNDDGRVLAMMPHPERVFRTVQMSYAPKTWGENSPWMRMFYNARLFVD